MEHFEIRTSAREEMLDITGRVQEAIERLGVRDGAVLVFVPHTTAGITINENADPDVVCDILEGLRRVAPRDARYRHAEGNSDGHIKSSLVGTNVTVPVSDGRLVLGTWQGVFFCEFDGPRSRRVTIQSLTV